VESLCFDVSSTCLNNWSRGEKAKREVKTRELKVGKENNIQMRE